LKVFQKKVLRGISGPVREKVTEAGDNCIIRNQKEDEIVEYVVLIVEMRNAYQILI
jgi:hypothetical protein